MLLFGHLGLTYAAAAGVDKAGLRNKLSKYNQSVDYRLIFIGSILPDLIDKFIIFFLSKETVHSGRIYAHSLLFIVFLACIGMLVWKEYKKPWLLVLAGCSTVHLILDSMWQYLYTLLWPFYDVFTSHITNIPQALAHALMSILDQKFKDVSVTSLAAALSDPYTGIPELIGFLIITIFVIRLILRKELGRFIKTGNVSK